MSSNTCQEIPISYQDYEQTLTRFEHTPSRKDSNIEDLSVKECRICLERDSDLINSCSCKGSIGYLHRQCLKTWLLKKMNPPTHNFQCQICHNPFNYSFQINKICQWDTFLTHFRQNPIKVSILLIIYLFLLVSTIYFAFLLNEVTKKQNILKRQVDSKLMMFVYSFLVIFCSILLVIGVSQFVKQFFVTKVVEIEVLERTVYQYRRVFSGEGRGEGGKVQLGSVKR